MAKVTVNSGICNFTTVITATSEDGQTVYIKLDTACPNIAKAVDELKEVDAFIELFSKLDKTLTYQALSKYLPHATCPIYSGILKAVEVAAGLALPGDVSITIEK